jgi:hypothetical protein
LMQAGAARNEIIVAEMTGDEIGEAGKMLV